MRLHAELYGIDAGVIPELLEAFDSAQAESDGRAVDAQEAADAA